MKTLIRLGDAQVDLSVRGRTCHFAGFVVRRLKLSMCETSWVRVLVRPCAFSTRDILWPACGSVLGVRVAKALSRLFQVDSWTNRIKQGGIVTDRPCCLVAQWPEWSHGSERS